MILFTVQFSSKSLNSWSKEYQPIRNPTTTPQYRETRESCDSRDSHDYDDYKLLLFLYMLQNLAVSCEEAV